MSGTNLNELVKIEQSNYHREWCMKNKDKVNQYAREWRRKNKDKVKQYNTEYWEKKALESIEQ